MRILSRGILVIVGLIVIALIAVWLGLSHIVKTVVQDQATDSLRLKTTLDSARAEMFAGKLTLDQLAIASPQGFSAAHMLEVPKIAVDASYAELRQKPVHVKGIEIDQPRLVIEQSGGSLNLRKAMQLMPKGDTSKEPLKLVIDRIEVKDAHVVVRPGLPGVQDEIDVNVPTLTMKDVGRGKGANNGAAIKDVTMQVMTALAEKAAQSDRLPAPAKALLHLGAASIAGNLGADAIKNVADQVPAAKGLQNLVPQARSPNK
jgi:uncharacterized protein involved in outer membrane biogenesis